MKAVTDPAKQLMDHLVRMLRWRVWLAERLQPTEWQATLLWAALAGFLGALGAAVFSASAEGIHLLLTNSHFGIVESIRRLPWWGRLLVPAFGGLAAGVVLLLGKQFVKGKSSTDYMEAIVLGDGRIPLRTSLVKVIASLFTIGSGGSIGREGPMVQTAAMLGSLLGRWRKFSTQQLRLLVACGAAAGIASAYNAPIAGSFFVAEIILGTIAMESLGPLVAASVTAALTMMVLNPSEHLYQVPHFELNSPLEMLPYLLLGLIAGTLAPMFLRTLRQAEVMFLGTKLPVVARLTFGGLLVGVIAINIPEVCGNGYTVIVDILNGNIPWLVLIGIACSKWLATACSVGSGAPGGVFTPTMFMGASAGYLYGVAVQAFWPGGPSPGACALVGMGAFLSAASRAPVMAVIMLFEMTLSYDIILPLLLCSVVAFFTARGIEGSTSLYSESLKRKAAEDPNAQLQFGRVGDLAKPNPPAVLDTARFAEIARLFISVRVNNLYVNDEVGKFVGAVALHDIKPYLADASLAELIIAKDILREDFPRVKTDESLAAALGKFLASDVQRLPVLDDEGRLMGSLSKNDLMLAIVEQRKKSAN